MLTWGSSSILHYLIEKNITENIVISTVCRKIAWEYQGNYSWEKCRSLIWNWEVSSFLSWVNPHFNPPGTGRWATEVSTALALLPSSRGSMQHQGCKPGSHLLLPGAELSPKTWLSFPCRLLWQEEAFFEMSSIKAWVHRSPYSQKAQLDLQQQGEIDGDSAHQQITNPLTQRIQFILHPSKKSIKSF